ncbi:MAG: hypothetical protein JW797_04170 [Bradymonadales bacterium]|nr:hypothetical protein [Bradymonadales bacterium]
MKRTVDSWRTVLTVVSSLSILMAVAPPPSTSPCQELHRPRAAWSVGESPVNPFGVTGPEGQVTDLPAELRQYLDGLTRIMEAHEWDRLMEGADPEHRAIQMGELDQSQELYLLELIGLHTVDNDIEEGVGYLSRFPRLERIRKVELTTWELVSHGEWLQVDGVLTLDRGETRRLQLFITRVGDRYFLTGAVG